MFFSSSTWMSSCSPHCTNLVFQDNGCASSVWSHHQEKAKLRNTECKQPDSCYMKESTMSEGLDVASVDAGASANKYCLKQTLVPDSSLGNDDTLISNEVNVDQETNQSLSLDAEVQKGLIKCNTFPLLRDVHAYSISMNSRSDSVGGAPHGQHSSASGASTYVRSVSLPSSSTLVSALKGSRALNGVMVMPELRVKWAPEVYDPPVSSLSHTVRGHRLCPKAKNNHKHNTSKSSWPTGSERKHRNIRSFNKMPDLQNVRLKGNNSLVLSDVFGKLKVADRFECDANGQVTCKNNFFREALS